MNEAQLRQTAERLILAQKRSVPIVRFPAVLDLAQLKEIIADSKRHGVKLPPELKLLTQDQIEDQDQVAYVDILIVAPWVKVAIEYEPPAPESTHTFSHYDEITPDGGINMINRGMYPYPNLDPEPGE
jgi:hypothetical protein